MAKVAVFASGKGSNFVAIHTYLRTHFGQRHSICCLVSDKPECLAVSYAQENAIPVIIMKYEKNKTKDIVEQELLSELAPFAPDLLVLAGFMRLLGKRLIDVYTKKIVNIHPSLLPKYPGVHGIEESFASKDTLLGVSIHYVDYGMDTGPILVQKSFERTGSETIEEIEARIHELEHSTYPVLVGALLDDVLKKNDGGRN